jgi:RNA polymerase sigma-70 factor (ECF subfamily)
LLVAAHRHAVDSVREPQDPAYDAPAARPVAAAPQDSADCLRTRAVLASMEPSEREAVELAYFGGYTHAEVASLVGADSGAGATLIRDGLLRLRVLMDAVA